MLELMSEHACAGSASWTGHSLVYGQHMPSGFTQDVHILQR